MLANSPGPWRAGAEDIFDASGKRILTARGTDTKAAQDIRNLTLAAAAPELRDALERVLTVGNKLDLSYKENRDAFDAAIRDGWNALAKTGRAQAGPLEPLDTETESR